MFKENVLRKPTYIFKKRYKTISLRCVKSTNMSSGGVVTCALIPSVQTLKPHSETYVGLFLSVMGYIHARSSPDSNDRRPETFATPCICVACLMVGIFGGRWRVREGGRPPGTSLTGQKAEALPFPLLLF